MSPLLMLPVLKLDCSLITRLSYQPGERYLGNLLSSLVVKVKINSQKIYKYCFCAWLFLYIL